jgi:RTX calcium-binding nonapeptide repeat (4 copies)
MGSVDARGSACDVRDDGRGRGGVRVGALVRGGSVGRGRGPDQRHARLHLPAGRLDLPAGHDQPSCALTLDASTAAGANFTGGGTTSGGGGGGGRGSGAPGPSTRGGACGTTTAAVHDICGSRATDSLAGTAGRDVIEGRGGADRLDGSAGADWLLGGPGNDSLFGGAGADRLDGGPGSDQIVGGPGSDLILGGPGDDTIDVRGGGADTVRCGPGRDVVRADANDILVGCEIRRVGSRLIPPTTPDRPSRRRPGADAGRATAPCSGAAERRPVTVSSPRIAAVDNSFGRSPHTSPPTTAPTSPLSTSANTDPLERTRLAVEGVLQRQQERRHGGQQRDRSWVAPQLRDPSPGDREGDASTHRCGRCSISARIASSGFCSPVSRRNSGGASLGFCSAAWRRSSFAPEQTVGGIPRYPWGDPHGDQRGGPMAACGIPSVAGVVYGSSTIRAATLPASTSAMASFTWSSGRVSRITRVLPAA